MRKSTPSLFPTVVSTNPRQGTRLWRLRVRSQPCVHDEGVLFDLLLARLNGGGRHVCCTYRIQPRDFVLRATWSVRTMGPASRTYILTRLELGNV